MNANAQNLWTWITTEMLSKKDKWANTASYTSKVLLADVTEMVDEIFGGYSDKKKLYKYGFTVGEERFWLKALPMQNKFNRAKKAYQVAQETENVVNILAWPSAGGGNSFNLHINVQRKAAVAKASADADGWSTV